MKRVPIPPIVDVLLCRPTATSPRQILSNLTLHAVTKILSNRSSKASLAWLSLIQHFGLITMQKICSLCLSIPSSLKWLSGFTQLPSVSHDNLGNRNSSNSSSVTPSSVLSPHRFFLIFNLSCKIFLKYLRMGSMRLSSSQQLPALGVSQLLLHSKTARVLWFCERRLYLSYVSSIVWPIKWFCRQLRFRILWYQSVQPQLTRRFNGLVMNTQRGGRVCECL